MSTTDPESLWRGTADVRATLRAPAAATPGERLAWLEESLLLANASGALARDRANRQALANRWAARHLPRTER